MKPQKVSDIDMAFGVKAMELLPPWNSIPDEFKRGNTKWNKLVSKLFFEGGKGISLKPKHGINSTEAYRHISCCLRSFEPKHEHKEAGCAYLFSQWFEDVQF